MKTPNFINLSSLIELSARLYESGDKVSILNVTLLSLMGKLMITGGVVLINQSGRIEPIIQKGNTDFDISELKNNFTPEEFTTILISKNQEGVRYIIPIRKTDKLYALICLGKPLIPHELSEEEKQYIELLSSITANAINNALMLDSYKHEKNIAEKRSQLLSALYEVSRDFGSLLSYDEIIRTLLLTIMGQLTVSKFAILIENLNREFEKIADRIGIDIEKDLLQELLGVETATFVEQSDLSDQAYTFCLENSISVISPMKVQGKKSGLLLIGKRMNEESFNSDNLIFIEAIGNTAMAAIENERLFREEIEKKRLESEINIALDIQRNLLPKSPPKLPNYDIFGITIPTYHVGGDYFDYIRINEELLLLAVADVSGKGIPASLIMANTQAALRVLARNNLSPIAIAQQINYLLYENTSSDKFVTCFFGILNHATNEFTYLNAGHNPPYLFRSDGTIYELNEGGLILGFLESGYKYKTGTIKMQQGDTIVMFTDGVTESHNLTMEDYGEDRLKELIITHINNSAEEIVNAIISGVKGFAGKAPQFDDITTIVLKCLG